MKELKNSMNKQQALYDDISDYKSPAIITGPSQRRDIVIIDINKLYAIELTVRFETRITNNAERKKINYKTIMSTIK